MLKTGKYTIITAIDQDGGSFLGEQMILESVGINEVVQLNNTTHEVTVRRMQDGSRIETPHRTNLTVTQQIGDNVTIMLGRDSVLILERGVTIGKRFIAHIKGGSKAMIIAYDSDDIPNDANLQPKPK